MRKPGLMGSEISPDSERDMIQEFNMALNTPLPNDLFSENDFFPFEFIRLYINGYIPSALIGIFLTKEFWLPIFPMDDPIINTLYRPLLTYLYSTLFYNHPKLILTEYPSRGKNRKIPTRPQPQKHEFFMDFFNCTCTPETKKIYFNQIFSSIPEIWDLQEGVFILAFSVMRYLVLKVKMEEMEEGCLGVLEVEAFVIQVIMLNSKEGLENGSGLFINKAILASGIICTVLQLGLFINAMCNFPIPYSSLVMSKIFDGNIFSRVWSFLKKKGKASDLLQREDLELFHKVLKLIYASGTCDPSEVPHEDQ